MLYPQPFGNVTAGGDKDYPVDYSHFNIQGTCVARSLRGRFGQGHLPRVDVSAEIGVKDKVKLSFPAFTGPWLHRDRPGALGIHGHRAAISGIIIVCGENVCVWTPNAEIKGGRVVRSPEMERRVKIFKQWYQGKGDIIVQANVEDGRLGCRSTSSRNWGSSPSNSSGARGQKHRRRGQAAHPGTGPTASQPGYIVLPDPLEATTEERYHAKGIKEFERHSRLGMVVEEDFYKTVEHLRHVGPNGSPSRPAPTVPWIWPGR